MRWKFSHLGTFKYLVRRRQFFSKLFEITHEKRTHMSLFAFSANRRIFLLARWRVLNFWVRFLSLWGLGKFKFPRVHSFRRVMMNTSGSGGLDPGVFADFYSYKAFYIIWGFCFFRRFFREDFFLNYIQSTLFLLIPQGLSQGTENSRYSYHTVCANESKFVPKV